MRITSVSLRGFQCFGLEDVSIRLDDLTAFVGPNASGKTASMVALSRVFGETQRQRTTVPEDFHLGPGERLKDHPERQLAIQVRLDFPELEEGNEDATDAVPEVFNQMIVDEPGSAPYALVRLEATWTDDGSVSGDVQQGAYWILSPVTGTEKVEDKQKARLHPGDRRRIRVAYVPAARDPEDQIRATAGTAFGRLLGKLALGEAGSELQVALDELQRQLRDLLGRENYLKRATNQMVRLL